MIIVSANDASDNVTIGYDYDIIILTIVLLDFSNAFDRLHHNLLPCIIYYMGQKKTHIYKKKSN